MPTVQLGRYGHLLDIQYNTVPPAYGKKIPNLEMICKFATL